MNGNQNDDYWAFFTRNWGDEGFCGSRDHTIDFDKNIAMFQIPWRSQALDVHLDASTSDLAGKDSGDVSITIRRGLGVDVASQLFDPSVKGWNEGTIHLVWTAGSPNAILPPLPNIIERSLETDFKDQVIDSLPTALREQWDNTVRKMGLVRDQSIAGQRLVVATLNSHLPRHRNHPCTWCLIPQCRPLKPVGFTFLLKPMVGVSLGSSRLLQPQPTLDRLLAPQDSDIGWLLSEE
jgi:hypothetical protein